MLGVFEKQTDDSRLDETAIRLGESLVCGRALSLVGGNALAYHLIVLQGLRDVIQQSAHVFTLVASLGKLFLKTGTLGPNLVAHTSGTNEGYKWRAIFLGAADGRKRHVLHVVRLHTSEPAFVEAGGALKSEPAKPVHDRPTA